MKRQPKPQFTDDQRYCVDLLAYVFGGHHHLTEVKEWGTGVAINHSGDLSTFDFNLMTLLVIEAHARAVRIGITSSGPRMVRIIAHRRRHGDGRFSERHPGLDDLIRMAEQRKSSDADAATPTPKEGGAR